MLKLVPHHIPKIGATNPLIALVEVITSHWLKAVSLERFPAIASQRVVQTLAPIVCLHRLSLRVTFN